MSMSLNLHSILSTLVGMHQVLDIQKWLGGKYYVIH